MEATVTGGLRVAVLIKQIPALESLQLGPDGRLVRAGQTLEINPFCRRAITLGVSLARDGRGECVVFTLAPLSGEDALREAIAAGADSGVLISDPAFAGSDTLVTARALVAALRIEGPFDVVICGRNSVDADTGQVGPEVAALMDMPFVANARELKIVSGELFAKSERDDGWSLVRAQLPAVLSAAERSCAPARADPAARGAVPSECIRRITAATLGPGPWGQQGSPTRVGEVRLLESHRRRARLTGPPAAQVAEAARLLSDCHQWAEESTRFGELCLNRGKRDPDARPVAVILEPSHGQAAHQLCATAADLAAQLNSTAVGLLPDGNDQWALGTWGLDRAVVIHGAKIEEDVANAGVKWIETDEPGVILLSGSLWGREVAARIAASLGLGLIGDAVDIDVCAGRVSAWKPALGGRLLARITTESHPQLITLRAAGTPRILPRSHDVTYSSLEIVPTDRITVLKSVHEDDAEVLFSARAVVGVGMGVSRSDYPLLEPLLAALGAPLVCTRKVADHGWLPRTRQVGLTGHHIAPRLYVAIGLQGNLNHVVGIRRAGVIVAINSDPDAPIFSEADIGIVGDWRDIVKPLATLIVSGSREATAYASASTVIAAHPMQMGESKVQGKAVPGAGRA